MSDAPTVAVQSVLYGNSPLEVTRATEAVAHSAALAITSELIGGWSHHVGDCSASQMLGQDALKELEQITQAAGGEFSYEFWDANLGSAGGHNRLADGGSSDLILILNPDAIVAPDTLSVLVTALGAGIGLAEARQIPLDHPKEYQAGTGDTSWASTACALTGRAIFDEVGGFDSTSFFLYGDDVDYSWRVRLAGHRVVHAPAARVFHDKRLTTSGDWPASDAEIYYSAEAAIFLAAKYSRPDIVDALVRRFDEEGGAVRSAAAEYRKRVSAGSMSQPIDSDHQVGEFVHGNYAIHRF